MVEGHLLQMAVRAKRKKPGLRPFCRASQGVRSGGLAVGRRRRHGRGRQRPPGVRALGSAWQECRGAPRGPAAAPRGAHGRCAPRAPAVYRARPSNSWPRGNTWACRGAPPAPWT